MGVKKEYIATYESAIAERDVNIREIRQKGKDIVDTLLLWSKHPKVLEILEVTEEEIFTAYHPPIPEGIDPQEFNYTKEIIVSEDVFEVKSFTYKPWKPVNETRFPKETIFIEGQSYCRSYIALGSFHSEDCENEVKDSMGYVKELYGYLDDFVTKHGLTAKNIDEALNRALEKVVNKYVTSLHEENYLIEDTEFDPEHYNNSQLNIEGPKEEITNAFDSKTKCHSTKEPDTSTGNIPNSKKKKDKKKRSKFFSKSRS